jgi:hypothetical protein
MTRTAAAAAIPILLSINVALFAQQEHVPVTVEGYIVADSPSPVPLPGSVTVFTLHEGALVTDTAAAGENGHFSLAVPAEPSEVMVWAEGFAPRRIQKWRQMDGMFALSPFEELRGHVLDMRSEPVEGAIVRARHEDENGGYLPGWIADSLEVQQTDEDGAFLIRDVIPYLQVVVYAEHVADSPEEPRRLLSASRSIPPAPDRSELIELRLTPISEQEEGR